MLTEIYTQACSIAYYLAVPAASIAVTALCVTDLRTSRNEIAREELREREARPKINSKDVNRVFPPPSRN